MTAPMDTADMNECCIEHVTDPFRRPPGGRETPGATTGCDRCGRRYVVISDGYRRFSRFAPGRRFVLMAPSPEADES